MDKNANKENINLTRLIGIARHVSGRPWSHRCFQKASPQLVGVGLSEVLPELCQNPPHIVGDKALGNTHDMYFVDAGYVPDEYVTADLPLLVLVLSRHPIRNLGSFWRFSG